VSGIEPDTGDPHDWTAADAGPFVHFAIEIFGPDRLMFGSNWPVSMLSGGYDTAWRELNTVFDQQLSDRERAAVLGGTAASVYGIPASRLPAVHVPVTGPST
jgi:L-fuconolactonase